MPGKTERSLEELYQDDRERADAVAFGRRTDLDRRGFLGGTGLAAMGVAVGGSIPFAKRSPERTAISQLSGQGRQAGGARRAAAGGGDPRIPPRRRDYADRQILHPEQRPDAGAGEGPRSLEDHRRRRGESKARADPGRAEKQVSAGHAAHGARMRRQR